MPSNERLQFVCLAWFLLYTCQERREKNIGTWTGKPVDMIDWLFNLTVNCTALFLVTNATMNV